MRPHEKIAKLFGCDIFRIKRSHVTVERHLRTLFDVLDIDVVIDVGANQGQYGSMLRRAGYQGYIVSFEPVSATFQQLCVRSEQDEKWRSYPYALGAKNESKLINVTRFSDLASFHKPNQFAEKIFSDHVEVSNTETVQIRTLDEVFDEVMKGIPDANIFLKMDTQGHDLEVLAGAVKSVKRILGMQSEVAVIQTYEGIPDYIESLTEFRKQGFEVTGFYPVSRDGDSQVVIEFDCVMVKCASVNYSN